jgi:hypothetical protein
MEGRDEEMLEDGNRGATFTPSGGTEDVDECIAGDESTLDHRQFGGHIVCVQSEFLIYS